MRAFGVIRVVCAVALAQGCAAAPDADAADACPAEHAAWVVDHGRHAGLVVRREDLVTVRPELAGTLPAGAYVEVGWGDARYYPDPDPGLGLGLRALLWPTASVLHLVVLPEPPVRYFRGAEVLAVSLSEAGHRDLLAFIGDSFAPGTGDRPPRRLGPPLYGQGGFYPARGRFHLFNTCNTWIARGLEDAGYPVSAGWVVTADQLLSRLEQTACARVSAP